ncbi:MAG: hypothetical protein MZV63_64830 [Marinilabiliales bacterium]|nr:hypothetical protein [Marinilabiliales bacterium]
MSEPLTREEERTCLDLARRALEHYFRDGERLRPPAASRASSRRSGARSSP